MTYTEPATEPLHWQDYTCDYCGGTAFSGLHRFAGQSLCTRCAVRESGEPACDFCNRPTFGDYRRISRAHTVAIACGVCTGKWEANYEEQGHD